TTPHIFAIHATSTPQIYTLSLHDALPIYKDLKELNTRSASENSELLTVMDDPYEACQDAHGIAILTEWDEFKDYDWRRIKDNMRSEEHTSELQSREKLVCRLLLEKKNTDQ